MIENVVINKKNVSIKEQETVQIGPVHDSCDQVQVELVRQGELIQFIDIVCDCGKKTRIACDYDSQ